MPNKKFLRKDLQDFVEYNAEQKEFIAKLDANESPYYIPDKILLELQEFLNNNKNSLRLYPDSNSTKLKTALAKFWKVQTNNILCACGSDQIIDYILKAFLNTGASVIIPVPTFSMYEISTKINRGKVIKINWLEESGEFILYTQEIIKQANKNNNTKNPEIIFLCSPNNPTGNLINPEDIKKIAKALPETLIIIDEAYGEFSQNNSLENSMISQINDFDNIIILRTFSKAFGLAGARVGYAIAQESLINNLNLVKDPFNLPSASEFLATKAIENYSLYQTQIQEIIAQRDFMFLELKKFSFLKVYNSSANFILLDSYISIKSKFLDAGILVRVFQELNNNKTTNNFERLRLTIGDKSQNKLVLEILNKIKNN